MQIKQSDVEVQPYIDGLKSSIRDLNFLSVSSVLQKLY
jgi:hypothetical protein